MVTSPFIFTSPQGLDVQPNVRLERYTTFQLGGPCRGLISCETPAQLEQAIQTLLSNHLPFLLIGGGSNIVVSDQGLDCYVVRYVSAQPQIQRDGNDLIVAASTLLDDLAKFAAQEGLEGINYASGIPGTVGGAIVGNAGAFGKQIGDVIASVTLLSLEGRKRDVGPEALGFRYRHSNLKETGDIVLSARIRCSPADRKALLAEREKTLAIRHEKHPDLQTHPCAGSFFRNIEPTSQAGQRQAAGWFLEQAGGKSLAVGGAKIFEKHANIIVKAKDCTAQDVYELSKLMAKAVKEKFQLDLVREVRFVGPFTGQTIKENLIW